MPRKKTTTPFDGFRRPTTTPVPDEVFDELLAELTGAEAKVLLYICRRTFGFKKDSDTISLNQIADGITTKEGKVLDRGTGLSKRHVQRALKNLESRHIVKVNRQMDAHGVNEINVYSLNFIEGVETLCPYPRDKMSIGVGTPVSTTTNSKQQTVYNTVNGDERNPIKNLPNLDQPHEKTDYVAQHILDQLGDTRSKEFYKLVAAKVPETVIRETLSEIKADGAKHPAKVFTHRMKLYAIEQLKKRIGSEK